MTTSRRWIVLFVLIAAGLAALQLSSTPQVQTVAVTPDVAVAAPDDAATRISDCVGTSNGDLQRELNDWANSQSGSPKPTPTANVGGATCPANTIAWYRDFDDDNYTSSAFSCCFTCGIAASPTSTACVDALNGETADYMPKSASADCDDDLATINPGIDETATARVANKVDEDCDGLDSCYVDADDDGMGTSVVTDPPAGTPLSVGPLSGCEVAPGVADVKGDACDTVRDVFAPDDWRGDCDADGTFGATVVEACSADLAFPASCVIVLPEAVVPDVKLLDCADTDDTTLGNPLWQADCDADGKYGRVTVKACSVSDARAAFRAKQSFCTGSSFAVVRVGIATGYVDECNDSSSSVKTEPAVYRADCDNDNVYGIDDPPIVACDLPEAITKLVGIRPGCEDIGNIVAQPANPTDKFDCNDTVAGIGASKELIADCDGDGVFGAQTVEACDSVEARAKFGALGNCQRAIDAPETVAIADSSNPFVRDCDDTNADYRRDETWYADCDGDTFFGSQTVTSCNPTTTQKAFENLRVACKNVPTSRVTQNPTGQPDCDDDVALYKPGQVWYADCDADSEYGQTKFLSCAPADARQAFAAYCTAIRTTAPLQTVFPVGGVADPNLSVTAIEPTSFDCWDGASAWKSTAVWYADCDRDGVFGTATHAACGANTAYESLCRNKPGENDCLVPTPNPNFFPYMTASPPSFTDCDDTECTVKPGSTVATPGRDWDCDGTVLCFPDGDGDDYGGLPAGTATNQARGAFCTDIPGYADNDDDCDDEDATFNPAAADLVADDFDQDCDGFVMCWYDVDEDGFGGGSDECVGVAPVETIEARDVPGFPGLPVGLTCEKYREDYGVPVTSAGGDCDGCDGDEFPGQKWHADCDGDGPVREETYSACDEADALSKAVCAGPATPVNVVNISGDVGTFDCLDDDELRYPGSGATCGTPGTPCERCEINEQLDDDCNGDFNSAGPTGAIDAISAVGGTLLDAYVDEDGDGFGSSELSGARQVCEVKEGLSANSLDCDDKDPNTRPGAPEVCDFKDQNCNDVTDEAEAIDPENTADAACIVLYRDLDEDGAGDPLVSQCVCVEPRRPLPVYVPRDDADLSALDTVNAVDPLQGRFANARYVGPPTDCDDAHADIKPHECNDGIDNDGDGLIDSRDAGCLVGAADGRRSASEANRAVTQQRDPSSIVVVLEQIDGHDNECDGAVPIIELDCDDDGSLPWLGTSYETPFETSVALDLQPCDPDSELTLSCWGEELDIACDPITGLWTTRYGQSEDGFGGRYAGGYRVFADTTCARFGDCDDECSSRCPGQDELCDGVDNDCSLVTTAPVEGFADLVAGVPGALETAYGAVSPAGTVVPAELDFDGDGAAACTEDFLDGDAEVHEAPLTCVGFAEDFPKTDCDDLCYAANSASTEVCNGFVDVCGAAPADREGVDADDDGRQTCGAYAPDDAILDEIVAVPVWVDCSSADRGGPALQDACASVVVPDGADELGVVPLVAARVGGEDCDAPLTAAQQALAARIEDAGFATWSADADLTASALVAAACAVGEGLPAGARIGGLCTVVEITLLRDDELLAADESTGAKLEPACEEVPEQHSVRTTWTRARILEARQGVVELECLRAFGLPCANIVDDTPRLALGAPVNVDVLFDPEVATGDTDGVVTQPVPWWLELGRFAPHSAAGMLMTCWGDPRVETIATRTGGDCDDGTTEAHRDLPEGPHDLVLAFEGINGDCARCVDGIDNNCDGRTDCEDPTCAVCFVGQGQGCAGARDVCSAPAEGGGCSTGMAGGVAVFTALPLLLLSAGRRRRDPAQ